MEDNSTNSSPKLVDRFRIWFRRFASNIFAAPYLPIILTIIFITTAISHLALILMSQPLSYWSDSSGAVGLGIFGEPLAFSAGMLIVVSIVYIMIGAVLLTFVNYRWSLIGWFIAQFSHFYLIEHTVSNCYASRWSVWFGEICQIKSLVPIYWFVVAIITGFILVFTFQPFDFSLENKKIEKGISYTSILIPGVWVILMVAGVILSAQKPTYGWIPIEIKNGPGPTRDAESAYDIKRNRLVMFGGASSYIGNDQWDYIDQTWEWDGYQWINVTPATQPLGRSDHSMAFDEKKGVVVLYGGVRNGEQLSDTWEWDGTSWKEVFSSDNPPPLSGQEMVYDPIREKIILYGGYSEGIFYNHAWEWDGKKWKRMELEGTSPVASVFAMAYNPDQNYIFGFLSGSGGTWHWTDNTWTRYYPEIEPSNRGWSTLVYDPSRQEFFLFGGISNNNMLNDTWTYNGQEWKE